MPVLSLNLIERSRWRQRCHDNFVDSMRRQIRHYTLEDLYPAIFEDDENGISVKKHKVMPHQQRFHDRVAPRSGKKGKDVKFCLLSGGVGSGKSINWTVDLIKRGLELPGYKTVIITAYDYFFEEFIWPTWRKVLPDDSPLYAYQKIKDREYGLTNGSTFRFKAYDDPEKVKGWDAHRILIEEASELGDGNNYKAQAIFGACTERLRAVPVAYPRQIDVCQNPKGHNWVWKVFIQGNPDGDEGILREIKPGENKDYPKGLIYREYEKSNETDIFYSIASGSDANSQMPPGYKETMAGILDEQTMDRMVRGSFAPMNTTVYGPPIYSSLTHVCQIDDFLAYFDEEVIPPYWPVFVGIDPGGALSPWAIEFYVITPEGHAACFGEIYKKAAGWQEIIGDIERFVTDRKLTEVRYAIDPHHASRKEGPDLISIQETFQEANINVECPHGTAKKDSGIYLIQDLMIRDHHVEAPFIVDEWLEEIDGWSIGACRFYYLADRSLVSNFNIHGVYAPWNLKEKEVFRRNTPSKRQPKESEEGLSPPVSEKLVDRDDHAQTAEMFAMLLWKPPAPARTRSKRDNSDVAFAGGGSYGGAGRAAKRGRGGGY